MRVMTIEISTSVRQLVGEAKDLFHVDKRFIFYCSRGWRSALATQTAQRMGLKRVGHIEGGFEAWQKAGGPVAKHEKK